MSPVNFSKIFIIILSLLIIAFGLFGAISANAVSMSLPATGTGGTPTNASSTPGTFINSFYQFALFLSGIIAFGAIVFGGVKYMTSAGNPSAQSEGKEWIYSALLGLLLLAGAYLILNTINPQITSLSLPALPQQFIPAPISPSTGSGFNGNGTSNGQGTSGGGFGGGGGNAF
jgi:uncharacterized membrane protein YgcG